MMSTRFYYGYALVGLMIVAYMYAMTYGDTDFTPNPVVGEFWCLKADRTDRGDTRLYSPEKVLAVQGGWGGWVRSHVWYGDKERELWLFKVNRVRCKDQSDTAQPLH